MFGSASEEEAEEGENAIQRHQQDTQEQEQDEGEESEDGGAFSGTTAVEPGMGMLALGKANQMDSGSDSEEDDFDAP
eukprot:COSAG02_NODE_2648_length_8336_cov_3.970378_4_plen_77_part_00